MEIKWGLVFDSVSEVSLLPLVHDSDLCCIFSLDVPHDVLDLKSIKLELVGGNVLKQGSCPQFFQGL